MELQWPLILFTSFLAWSAGVFATHGTLAIRKIRTKAHVQLLATALVLMVIGGIAVFMHLQHWERIFNGFGHITSGITQELIAVVVMFIVMVLLFAQQRRNDDGSVPVWTGVLAVVVALALIVAMGHSYMLPSRPAWDSILQLCSLLGAACVMGPATAAVVLTVRGEDAGVLWKTAFAGSIVNAVTTLCYLVGMGAAQARYTDIGYYYDPANLARGMIDFDGATGLLSGGRAVLVVLIVVLAVVPIVVLFLQRGKKGASSAESGAAEDAGAAGDGAAGAAGALAGNLGADLSRWIPAGVVVSLAGFAAAIMLRVVFYELGHAVYIFF